MIVIKIAIITLLVLWALVILITIALLAVSALRVTRRRRTVDDLDRRSGFGRAAGDPFLHPFGDMQSIPRERMMVARDFRAWGIPQHQDSAAVAHRRNESGGRPASLSGTAVVLTFPKRGA